jgi:hypothetical protein
LPFEFKRGLRLREAEEWLTARGMQVFAHDLLSYRDMSERFPPDTRSMSATCCFHMGCDGPEELKRMVAQLAPGEVLTVVEAESEAHARYGPV